MWDTFQVNYILSIDIWSFWRCTGLFVIVLVIPTYLYGFQRKYSLFKYIKYTKSTCILSICVVWFGWRSKEPTSWYTLSSRPHHGFFTSPWMYRCHISYRSKAHASCDAYQIQKQSRSQQMLRVVTFVYTYRYNVHAHSMHTLLLIGHYSNVCGVSFSSKQKLVVHMD